MMGSFFYHLRVIIGDPKLLMGQHLVVYMNRQILHRSPIFGYSAYYLRFGHYFYLPFWFILFLYFISMYKIINFYLL